MPERACQQVIATALKHSAIAVELSKSDGAVMATFKMKGDLRASVKLKATFPQVVAFLLKKSHIIEQSESAFSAIGRLS